MLRLTRTVDLVHVPGRVHTLLFPMQRWKSFPRFFLLAVLLIGLLAGISAPAFVNQNAKAAPLNQTPSMEIIISEVAWVGTQASTDDEWIELYNPSSIDVVDISDWRLVSSDGIVDIIFQTGTIIQPLSFFLLERTREQVTNVPSDLRYAGSLNDAGAILRLRKSDGSIVDTANNDGGPWPAGGGANFSSMERVINGGVVSPDSIGGWLTFADTIFAAQDASNNDIHGTPGTPNWAFTVTATPTATLTPSNTPTSTITFTPSITPTITGTRPTPTRTGTATRTATPNPPLLTVIINEVAWMGTIASTSDEWIELYNPGTVAVDLTGWVLRADDESPFITWSALDLTNVFIQPGQYYLLERSDDTTVTSFTANKIYQGSLDDSPGDILKLYDNSGRLIDTANSNGGDWPAGVSTTTFRRSMERITPIIADGIASWATFVGTDSGARDANNGVINGTPGFKNWVSNVTLTPSRTPTATSRFQPTATVRPRTATPTPFGGPVPVGRPFINEFLPRPGFDWNLDGKVDTFDEFIELKNVGNADMNLSGWRLDDSADFPGALSSAPYTITDLILKPGEYAVFYASQTNILLSDGGDSVRLFDASGDIMDVIDFTIAKVEDESVCRLPDGNGFGSWFNDCTPTPNLTNSHDGQVPTLPEDNSATPFCALPDTLPEDFLFAECRGYGANIWDNFYWDEFGWMGDQIVPENKNKWKSFIE